MIKVKRIYKAIEFPVLTKEQLKEAESLRNIPDEEIDTSDIPEVRGNGCIYYNGGSINKLKTKF